MDREILATMARIMFPDTGEIDQHLTIDEITRLVGNRQTNTIAAAPGTVSLVYWEDKQFGPVPSENIQRDLSSLPPFDLIHAKYANGAMYIAVYLFTITGKNMCRHAGPVPIQPNSAWV